MPTFKEQLAAIAKMRQQRQDCDEKLYQTRLQIQRMQLQLKRANEAHTVDRLDRQQLAALKARMVRMQALLVELNRELASLETVFSKARDNEQLIVFLQNKIKALQTNITLTSDRIGDIQQDTAGDLTEMEQLRSPFSRFATPTRRSTSRIRESRTRKRSAETSGKSCQRKEKRHTGQTSQLARKHKRITDNQLRELLNPSFVYKAETEENLQGLRGQEERLAAELSRCDKDLKDHIGVLYRDPHPRGVVKELDDAVPFLLMPVKIETRFIQSVEGRQELWLRVYPDEIAIHTHEKTLTDREVAAGKLYWTELLVAEYSEAEKENRRKSAWSHVANQFKSQRAAWIATQTKPTDWNTLLTLPGVANVFDLLRGQDAAFFNNLINSLADEAVKTAFQDAVAAEDTAAFIVLAEKHKYTEGVNQVTQKWITTFPTHDLTKTDAWSRAPRTQVMPDKFVITLYRKGTAPREIVGKPIPDTLYVGPNPALADTEITKNDEKIVFAESFDWVSDFPRATDVGMGFRIPLSTDEARNGFDKIVVLGVYLSANETDSAQVLEDLIDNHHYSPKGFSLVPNGTPTNNTERNGSGYTDNDDFNDVSYFVETGQPLFQPTDSTDGKRLADALGIGYEPLQYVRNSDNTDFIEAVAMNTALYPATLGYYFEALLSPVVKERDRDRLRAFFKTYITARGPLSAIRVGNQPYGVLVTSDFTNWKIQAEEEQAVSLDIRFTANRPSDFLARLKKVLAFFENEFNGHVKNISYVGKPTTKDLTSAKILLEVLGLQASSVEFYQRIGYTYDYLANLKAFKEGGKYQSELWNSANNAILINLFLKNNLGYVSAAGDKRAKVLQLIYQHFHLRLNAANLIDDQPLSEDPTKSKAKDYIQWLREAVDLKKVEKQDFGTQPVPTSLLYMMLRNAFLLNLYQGSYDWLKTRYNFTDLPAKEYAFKDSMTAIQSKAKQPSVWEYMHADIGKLDPTSPLSTMTVGNHLLINGHAELEAAFLTEMKKSLEVLGKMSNAALERCFTEHLDLCSYRLDAWQSGFFSMRLERQRKQIVEDGGIIKSGKGIYLGAYGYVEEVRPAQNQRISNDAVPTKLRPTNNNDIFTYPTGKNGGFVHAPSINHASAAAVLRAGYLSHVNTTNPDMLAVNLSSERVRRAMFILDGLRNGQMLEALLGYQFERALHDKAASLNKFILDFRIAFPIEQKELPQQGTGVATESLPPYNVVNGLKLSEFGDIKASSIKFIVVPSAGDLTIFNEEKERLKDSLDAVKDLLMAENFYQLVLGNFDRVAAVNLAQKDAHYPPEMQVVQTPRGAQLAFTNRVTLHFEDTPMSVNPLQAFAIPMTPRALMEPSLNKWLYDVLGDPSVFRCEIGIVKTAKDVNGVEIQTFDNIQEVSLIESGLQPIDFVYTVGNELDTIGASEIEARLAHIYRIRNGLDDTQTVRIFFNKPDGSSKIGQLLPLARRLRALIAESRPLNARDFSASSRQDDLLIDKTSPKGFDVNDLQIRVETAHDALQNLKNGLDIMAISVQIDADILTTLKQAFDRFQANKIDFDTEGVATSFAVSNTYLLRSVLEKISLFGITHAFPRSSTGISETDKIDVLKQAYEIFKTLNEVLKRYTVLFATLNPAMTIEKQVDIWTQLAKIIFGEIFNPLPKFTYQNFADITAAEADRSQLLTYGSTQAGISETVLVDEWLESVARVRPKLHKWEVIRTLSDTLGNTPMQTIQVPYRAKDSWLAVEFPEKDPQQPTKPFQLLRDTVSIVAHGAAAFLTPTRQNGIMLDDWTEEIPTTEETTGVAFHYNQPNAMPPQALLLCVTPDITGSWNWDDLMNIINDTFDRAKRRAVEPTHLENRYEWVTLLPALVSEFTTTGTNITLDLALNLKVKALAEAYKIKI